MTLLYRFTDLIYGKLEQNNTIATTRAECSTSPTELSYVDPPDY